MKKWIISLALMVTATSFIYAQCTVIANQDKTIECGKTAHLVADILPVITDYDTITGGLVYFYNQSIGFIVRDSKIHRTIDGGLTWQTFSFPIATDVNSINFVSPLTGFASSDNTIARTFDGGITWSIVFQDLSVMLKRTKFVSANVGFYLDYYNKIMKSVDGGSNWQLLYTAPFATTFYCFEFINEQTGFVFCENMDEHINTISATFDGGASWSPVVSGEMPLINDIRFLDGQIGFAAGLNMLKTYDGGHHWANMCQTPWASAIAIMDSTSGYITSGNHIYRFFDNGKDILEVTPNMPSVSGVACPDNQSAFVTTSGGLYKYHTPNSILWEPAAGLSAINLPNPVASPDTVINYQVSMEDINGSTDDENVIISVEGSKLSPQICVVTVDTATAHNKIIWDPSAYPVAEEFYIYREGNVLNQFDKIGSVSATQAGEFIDELSNGLIKSERYRLTFLDKCSFETSNGYSHKTMHLSINQGVGNAWNLIWDEYSGAAVLTYNIYRGAVSGNLQLIASVSGSNSQYTDMTGSAGNVYYQVEAVLDALCGGKKSTVSSFSNIAKHLSSQGTQSDDVADGFRIGNNPVTDRFSIQTGDIEKLDVLYLTSLSGTPLKEWKQPRFSTFDISELPPGIYLLNAGFKGSDQKVIRKIVKL